MSAAIFGTGVAISNTFMSHFNPSKSPFYGVVAFGTAALVLSCERIASEHWLAVAIPIWSVLMIAWSLSLVDRHTIERGAYYDQLRFARSFSISSALMALVLTAREVDSFPNAFWFNYVACLIQVVIFLLYTWARNLVEDAVEDMNFVQFSLITCTFLVGASFALSRSAQQAPTPGSGGDADMALRYLGSAVALYSLWGLCVMRWIKHLSTLIEVRRPAAP